MISESVELLPGFTNEWEEIEKLKLKATQFLKSEYATPVTNGTAAIEVALKALDLPRGSAVVVPDISFFATATAVANCGLVPVFGDVSTEHYGISLEEVKALHTSEVKAVIVVHFSGIVNREILEIAEYCKEHDLKLIEDCAQAIGCFAGERHVSTIGDIGTFSFQSSKLVSAGEGGLVVTQSEEYANNIAAIVNWGLGLEGSTRLLNLPCSNYRMSAQLAFIVSQKFDEIDIIIEKRKSDVESLKDACSTKKVSVAVPGDSDQFKDCLFFLPVLSTENKNTIEPREEHPLRKSILVHSIIKKLFPDLEQPYVELNSRIKRTDWKSDTVLKTVDFINIFQVTDLDADEVASWYQV